MNICKHDGNVFHSSGPEIRTVALWPHEHQQITQFCGGYSQTEGSRVKDIAILPQGLLISSRPRFNT